VTSGSSDANGGGRGGGPRAVEDESPGGDAPTHRIHPTIWEPTTFVLGLGMAVLGAIIGIQLITRVGITPNSSVIGAMVAVTISRIPLAALRGLGDLHRQNLLQTVISGATFGGANALLLPIGIPWVMGRPDLVLPMLCGAFLALIIDATILYRVFDSTTFPATGLWPSGVATSEVLIAGDEGGGRARLLVAGSVAGGTGQLFGIPMDVFGVCWIGNAWALSMFAVGLLLRAYGPVMFGVDLNAAYVPHGVMVGAGIVALGQMIWAVRDQGRAGGEDARRPTVSGHAFGKALGNGLVMYLMAATGLALTTGVLTEMSPPMMLGFVLFAGGAALISELVVGLSAMHAGWFPAFATSLIFLVVGMLLGFPELPLAVLVGFTSATGPAFADMGYDLKAGWILRGSGTDPEFERAGRRQQYFAELLGFVIAGLFVWFAWERYFSADLIPPLDRVFASTIAAGASPELARSILLWAVPGALVQLAGGPSRQMGVLLATGLLILNPAAGWTAAGALVVRAGVLRRWGKEAEGAMYVTAGGFIAGSAVVGFGSGIWRAR
jgi:uncharacterized oligopeptide transporter (OPT) family protein